MIFVQKLFEKLEILDQEKCFSAKKYSKIEKISPFFKKYLTLFALSLNSKTFLLIKFEIQLFKKQATPFLPRFELQKTISFFKNC